MPCGTGSPCQQMTARPRAARETRMCWHIETSKNDQIKTDLPSRYSVARLRSRYTCEDSSEFVRVQGR